VQIPTERQTAEREKAAIGGFIAETRDEMETISGGNSNSEFCGLVDHPVKHATHLIIPIQQALMFLRIYVLKVF